MISVIIPVYNSAQYLAQCLDSVLQQTYNDLQIICIDDGSTDDSAEILKEYAQKDSRILVIHQANSGVSAARNAGLDRAIGEFIAFVDSDDTMDPDMYEILTDLVQVEQADIAHCGYRRVHIDGSCKEVQGTGCRLVQDSQEAAQCLLTGRYFTGGLWNKLYRRALFEELRFDPALKINEDVLMNCQLFSRARKIVFWDVPKYCYFEHTDSSCSRTKQVKKKQDCVHAAERILELFRRTPLEDTCVRKLQHALLELYRVRLLAADRDSNRECIRLREQIRQNFRSHRIDSSRMLWNYRFMRWLPGVYRVVYRVYDRIRKPNWDL